MYYIYMKTCLEKRNIPRRENVRIMGLEGIDVSLVNSVLRGLVGLINPETKDGTLHSIPTIKPSIQTSPFEKKLEEYGELLSVKDLTDIFQCDRRTISNWEVEGYIQNVAETTQETNSVGRRKRGKEKRYRKEAVIRQVKLQEKYNALLGR